MSIVKFRALIILSLVFSVLSVILDFATQRQLPIQIQQYFLEIEQEELNAQDLVLVIAGLALLAYSVIVIVLMFMMNKHARLLYTILILVVILITPFLGVVVQNGVVNLFDCLSLTIEGVLLGAMYYSDLKVHFEK